MASLASQPALGELLPLPQQVLELQAAFIGAGDPPRRCFLCLHNDSSTTTSPIVRNTVSYTTEEQDRQESWFSAYSGTNLLLTL